MRVHKGDQVEVIAGKDRGRQGRVLAALPKKGKVIVEGVNRVKRHTKVSQTRRGGKTGGIETKEAPIDVSNVMVVDPDDKKPTRLGSRRGDDERPIRFSRRTGKDL